MSGHPKWISLYGLSALVPSATDLEFECGIRDPVRDSASHEALSWATANLLTSMGLLSHVHRR